MKRFFFGKKNISAEVSIAYKERHDSGNASWATITLPHGLYVQILSGSD